MIGARRRARKGRLPPFLLCIFIFLVSVHGRHADARDGQISRFSTVSAGCTLVDHITSCMSTDNWQLAAAPFEIFATRAKSTGLTAANGCFLADSVEKVENRTTSKISQKLIFGATPGQRCSMVVFPSDVAPHAAHETHQQPSRIFVPQPQKAFSIVSAYSGLRCSRRLPLRSMLLIRVIRTITI
jgi:hypothetical protein